MSDPRRSVMVGRSFLRFLAVLISVLGLTTSVPYARVLSDNDGTAGTTALDSTGSVTITRVINTFEEAVREPGLASVLPSESDGVILDIRDGFVLERGAVGEATTGTLFAVSGGCCMDRAKTFSSGEVVQVQYQPAVSHSSGTTGDRQQPGLSFKEDIDAGTAVVHSVYILEHSHSETYYHFLIEALPRLEHLWTIISADESIKIFQTSSFASEAFKLLGLGPRRACEGRRTVYPRVFLPPPRENTRSEPAIARLKGMVGRLISGAGLAETEPREKPTWVVIDRTGARQRAILNHHELMAGLRETFAGVVFLEFRHDAMLYSEDGNRIDLATGRSLQGGVEMSLRSFRSCWGVIAPHGAGLSNMVYVAKQNASVVEIVGEGQRGKVYEQLAEELGHRHLYISSPHVTWRNTNMEVDVPAVLEAIAPVFAEFSGQ